MRTHDVRMCVCSVGSPHVRQFSQPGSPSHSSAARPQVLFTTGPGVEPNIESVACEISTLTAPILPAHPHHHHHDDKCDHDDVSHGHNHGYKASSKVVDVEAGPVTHVLEVRDRRATSNPS
jgi:hypothetical protein